jgi:flagellin-like protein
MNKRGISPLIATSLLVGMTIVIGVVVIGFGHNILYSVQQNQELDLVKAGLVNYEVYFKDTNCNETGNCYKMLFSNGENFPLKFSVITHAEFGSHISGPENYLLNAYEQKVFIITYPSDLGMANYAEVDAFVVEE